MPLCVVPVTFVIQHSEYKHVIENEVTASQCYCSRYDVATQHGNIMNIPSSNVSILKPWCDSIIEVMNTQLKATCTLCISHCVIITSLYLMVGLLLYIVTWTVVERETGQELDCQYEWTWHYQWVNFITCPTGLKDISYNLW